MLGLSFPAPFHTYRWPCKPLVISFSLLLHTRDKSYLQTKLSWIWQVMHV
ncbi:hypothetical protein HanRHA438_Chr02g0079271 [Helianthus annuus]|nr:hypothetical protein HanRHA438_Chr02g0079271 [Helianthus annuus]